MRRYQPPNIPFVEARYTGGKQKRPTVIILTLSFTTSEKGAALAVANRHHRSTSPTYSCHYVVDEAEAYRCIPDDVSAYHGYKRAIEINICAEPIEDESSWYNHTQHAVIQRTAKIVADLLLTYKIPTRYLDNDAETRWTTKRKSRRLGGIIIRVPGAWPHDLFMTYVNAEKTLRSFGY